MKTLGAMLMLVLATVALPAAPQDQITIAAASANGGDTVNLAVSVRDASGTLLGTDSGSGNRIQAIAFRVLFSPPSAIASASFHRAGVLQSLTPLYEQTVTSPGAIGYLVLFEEATQPIPFTTNAAAPGDSIGTLQITIASPNAGSTVALTLDPLTTELSNQAGTVVETTFNHGLTLTSGSIAILGSSTSTALASSVNPSITGQSVAFTASVTSQTPGTIGGSVTFYDGAQAMGSAPVQSGQAVYSTNSLTAGAHSISAGFQGAPGFLPSTSPVVTQQVNVGVVPPSGVTASALSTTSVSISWSQVVNASYYEVLRRANGGPLTHVSWPSPTSFTDTNLTPNTTYLYVVRAVNSQGTSSADSAMDPATTMIFTNDPMVAGQTTVKLVHLLELRTAVNAFRASANLAPMTFTDPAPSSSTLVRKIHIDELRSALLPALTPLGLAAPPFTDSSITAQATTIKAAHFQELRNAVK